MAMGGLMQLLLLFHVFILMFVFDLKHFLADYPLQNSYMLRKFGKEASVWVMPLVAHAGVHALMTMAILGVYSVLITFYELGTIHPQRVIALGMVDFVIHFVMDRIKASPNMLGRFRSLSPKEMQKAISGLRSKQQNVRFASRRNIKMNRNFWWSLGFDQMVHGMTNNLVILLTFIWGVTV